MTNNSKGSRKVPLFYRGLIIFLIGGIPTGIILYCLNIKGLDIFQDIIIGSIIGMIPLIIALAKSDKIFPPEPRGKMPKGYESQ